MSKLERAIFIGCVFLVSFIFVALCFAEIDNEKLADAIYRAEGGDRTKFPYGIKSINTFGDKTVARKICLNTIRNNKMRFLKQNKYDDFVTFLGSRYCPPSAHSLNGNWVRLVKYFLRNESRIK